MTKDCAALIIDEGVLRVVRIRAAHTGKSESEVIEEALRRDFDKLEQIWAKVRNPLPEDEAVKLAIAEVHAARKERDEAGGS